jgi:hypothetical protein
MKIPAGKIMYAVHDVYSDCGNETYAKVKTNGFLLRCGAILDDGPRQLIDSDRVKSVAFAMIDDERCKSLFAKLGIEEEEK